MTFVDAARTILDQAREPLHFREITRRAIAEGLIDVEGNTPWNSMNGTLRRTIRRESSTGDIIAVGDGYFALRCWGLPAEDLGDSDGFDATEALSGLDYKWRSIQSKAMRLFATPYEQPVKRSLQRALSLAFMWGISNLMGAVSLLLGQDSALGRGLGAQLFRSGLANAGLAWVGSDLLAAEYESEVTCEAEETDQVLLDEQSPAYAACLLLGIIQLGRGARLARCNETMSRKRGKGLGLLLQGGFYVALALVGLLLGRQEKSKG